MSAPLPVSPAAPSPASLMAPPTAPLTAPLTEFVAAELAAPVAGEIRAAGEALAKRLGGVAVLFYGSVLRTGDLAGVLDFYVLTEKRLGSIGRRIGLGLLWPDVSFHEITVSGEMLRAKVATMPLATYERAASGAYLDTTIWTRFVQPSALVWRRTAEAERRVREAIEAAAMTAARFAAVVGPREGAAEEYWSALFRETYSAELRVEAPGREAQIIDYHPERYRVLLPIAWRAAGIPVRAHGEMLVPMVPTTEFRRIMHAWLTRVRVGKALNAARLVKAAFTFEGATRYGLWKVERHTGVQVDLTPWRERHPVLAAPGVLWRVLRARGR